MPLMTTRAMYDVAYRQGFAIGAFNINGIESVKAVTEAAAEMDSPVILQACILARRQMGDAYIRKLIEAAVETSSVPIALNLDHGEDFEVCKSAVDAGFTSVMVDGSRFSLADNIALTRRVVEYAHSKGVPVEAELGKIGGAEGGLEIAAKKATLTDPAQAVEFVRESGCDSLAVAIGTAHGAYKFTGEPALDFDRLAAIKKALPGFPLVLHGASSVPQEYVALANEFGAAFGGARGVPEDMITRAASIGVCKVNINTDLCITMVANIRKFFAENLQTVEPRDYLAPGRAAVKALVKEKISVLGSAGKAPAILARFAEIGGEKRR